MEPNSVMAQRDLKTRLAVWLKYHHTLHVNTGWLSVRLPMVPAWLWFWADGYVTRWNDAHA